MFAQTLCWNRPTHAQNLFQKEALLCGSDFLLRRHLFLKIDWTFYKIWWFFIKCSKSMPAIVICNVSRGRKSSTTQCLHILCVEIDPPMPKMHMKMRRCYVDLICCSGGNFFHKIDWQCLWNLMFFINFYKSMPTIVISTASRRHRTWKTECMHRVCVEIGPPMTKTYFKMRRCDADLIFAQEARCS